jgi:hypothetical protein
VIEAVGAARVAKPLDQLHRLPGIVWVARDPRLHVGVGDIAGPDHGVGDLREAVEERVGKLLAVGRVIHRAQEAGIGYDRRVRREVLREEGDRVGLHHVDVAVGPTVAHLDGLLVGEGLAECHVELAGEDVRE